MYLTGWIPKRRMCVGFSLLVVVSINQLLPKKITEASIFFPSQSRKVKDKRGVPEKQG